MAAAAQIETTFRLTLHTLGRLSTPEIARAFLVPVATMAQRLARARRKIRDAGIPYHAARSDLLRRTNQREAAADAYQRAVALCGNRAERAYLQRRLDEMLNLAA